MTLDIDIGDGADALTINQLRDALDGTYWSSGLNASVGSGDMDVDVSPGSGVLNTNDVGITATQSVNFAEDTDPTNPRKAVIYLDDTNTVRKAVGDPTPATPENEVRERTWSPSPPAKVPGIVIAEVWIAADDTSLDTEDIRDRRLSNAAASSGAATIEATTQYIDFNTAAVSGDLTVSNTDLTLGLRTDQLGPGHRDSLAIEDNYNNTGFKFEISENVQNVEFYTHSIGNDYYHPDYYELQDSSGAVLDTTDWPGQSTWFSFSGVNWDPTETYTVVVNQVMGATRWTTGVGGSLRTTPLTTSVGDWTITEGIEKGSSTNNIYMIMGMRTERDVLSGTGRVQFPSESVVDSWLAAVYRADESFGSVTADLVDSNGDVIQSDISETTTITNVGTDTNVSLQFTLSRPNLSDTPRVKFAGRKLRR